MSELPHPASKFTPFELALPNGAITSGIRYIPPVHPTATPIRPLIVLLHGASMTAHQFDINATNTASLAAEALSIPIVSLNRPGYKSSTSVYPIPDGSTYHKEIGQILHHHILPRIWQDFGVPNHCGGMVLLGHSLASPGIIIAAAMHVKEIDDNYPLAGLIIYGWGCQQAKDVKNTPDDNTEEAVARWRNRNLFSEPDLKAVDRDMMQYVEALSHQFEMEEVLEVVTGPWNSYWRSYADQINVPIMFANGEHDRLWSGELEHIRLYETMFPKCPRFDGSVVKGAPHCIEWSRFAQGFYARCFSFALEVTIWHAIQAEIQAVKR